MVGGLLPMLLGILKVERGRLGGNVWISYEGGGGGRR